MLNLYITKVLDNALDYLPSLNKDFQKRVLKNKHLKKQQQMVTTELLLIYALKKLGYDKEIIVEYKPKPILLNSEYKISKSHSEDYCLVAVSSEEVGADIQIIKDVKTPERILSKKELQNYNKGIKDEVFTLYWTAKESYIKYYGSLTKPYVEIVYEIEQKINNFTAGKIGKLYCYQSYFKNYSFAVATKLFIAPDVFFVSNKSLIEENEL